MRFLGSASVDPHIDGGMREFMVMPAQNCLRIPDTMEWSEAAAVEPLSIALHACSRAGVIPGKAALVYGGGMIGQLVLLVLRAMGAGSVTLADPVASRREVACTLGADRTFDPAHQDTPGDFALVFEASGSPAAVTAALHAAERGGTIVQIGTINREVTLPANLVMVKELQVLGSFRTAHTFATGLQLLANRRIDLRPLITHCFPIESVSEAFAATGGETALKVQLEIGS
jgi:L-idonate 5-dehydrogenase